MDAADASPAVRLVWTRGPGADACIDGADLAGRVTATLGRPVVAAEDGDVAGDGRARLVGEVTPFGRGWVAVVQVRGAGTPPLRREVTLDAADCRQLDEALVLVVALMADSAQPSAPRLRLPPRAPSVTMALGADVAVASGMLPGVAPGFGLSADVAFPPLWHVALWGHAWPPSVAYAGPYGVSLAAWTFGAGPCLATGGAADSPGPRFSLFGCVGASGGVIYASGVQLDLSRSRERPYVQGEVRAGARARLSGLVAGRLELGAGVPIARDTYAYTGPDMLEHAVFHTAAVVPFAVLGIEIRTP